MEWGRILHMQSKEVLQSSGELEFASPGKQSTRSSQRGHRSATTADGHRITMASREVWVHTPSVLHYVVMPTRVGRVFVLMSRTGVVDVVLDTGRATVGDPGGGDPMRIIASRFPDAELIPDDGTRLSWAEAVVARIDGAFAETDAPVDLSWSSLSAFATPSADEKHDARGQSGMQSAATPEDAN